MNTRSGWCTGGIVAMVLVLGAGVSALAQSTPVLDFGADPDAFEAVELDAAVTLSGDFTIEYWFKTRQADAWRLINSSASYNYSMGHIAANDIRFYIPTVNIYTDPAFAVDAWEHIAVTRESNAIRVYRNGVSVETSSETWDGEIRLDRIGGRSTLTGASAYDGQAAEVRVWDHARDASQIQTYMNYRLPASASGLLGYWPLNEGSGTDVSDGSANDNTGTVVNAQWIVAADLDLPAFPEGFLVAAPFSLADMETGSMRFTNSNEVELVDFPIPTGYTDFQITEDGDPGLLGSWTPTNAVPATEEFTLPATDTNITLYAWFTNLSETVALQRATGEIVYTTVAPEAAIRASLARTTAGFTVHIAGIDLDAGSTSGLYDGEPIGFYQLQAIWDGGPHADLTPGEPYVSLTNAADTYTLKLRVVNEAGNADTAVATCTLTVTVADDLPADGDRYAAVGNLFAAAPYDNWTNAAASIQTAVNATTTDAETIRVWPGRYTLPTNAVYGNDSWNVVNLTRPLNLRSAGAAEDTIIDGQGEYRAIRGAYSSTTDFLLDGFTVTNGIAPDGGGFYLNVASGNIPGAIRNCVFADNVASTGSGGAISAYAGGAVSRGTLTISNCVFRANRMLAAGTGAQGGGAIDIYNSSPQYIYDSLFESNSAAFAERGGGALRLNQARMLVENSRFLNNQGPTSGGLTTGGGVAYAHSYVKLTFRNCLLTGNRAVRGGAIHLGESTGNVGTFLNCTVADNSSGVYMDNRTTALPKLNLTNTVCYHNTSYNISLRSADPGGLVTIWNSCTPSTSFDADFDAHNNVTDDPELVDRDAGNYRLSRNSLCINAGLNDLNWMASAVDLDGNPRVDKVSRQVDIGAYERVFHGTTIMVR